MTVALARRLVWDGVVAPEEANLALLAHVMLRVSFLQALLEHNSELAPRLEPELGAMRPGVSTVVIVDRELMRRLPAGLCSTLLAVPVGKDPRTGATKVLAADPSDPHIAEEFSYHLGGPVEVGKAPLRAMLLAAAQTLESEVGPTGTPAFGTQVLSDGPKPSQSEPPIPLVRVSAEAARGPVTVKGVAPQGTSTGYVAPVVVGAGTSHRPTSEPVIELTRAKSLAPPVTVKGTGPGSAPASDPHSASAGAPSGESETGPLTPIEDSRREEFEQANTPEEVTSVVVRGLARVARRVLVLAVRGKVFEGRDANDDASRSGIRNLVVSADRPSVLLTAIQSGSYVGPVPETRVHGDLARLLGGFTDQIAVGTVRVSGRAALVYVMAGFDTAFLATRRAAELAQVAGNALERIVRKRRK
jgi:MshEN domain